ncbi:MAG: hypothetical protein ACO1OY_08185 [Ramlibacter sp.]|jgi:hypothetical protein
MSTFSDAAHPVFQQPRARMLWLVLGALAAGQLFAIWLLCTHQVRKAEARSNEVLVQQMALSDCLQYVPGSTIASCSRGIDGGVQAQAAHAPAVAGAMPVSFSVR